jgi:predicted transposase YdaD
MTILRESPWYQQIKEEGKQEGIITGRQEGRQQEILSSIELALEISFGNQGLNLMSLISQITDLEKLKIIQRGVLTTKNLDELSEIIQIVI